MKNNENLNRVKALLFSWAALFLVSLMLLFCTGCSKDSISNNCGVVINKIRKCGGTVNMDCGFEWRIFIEAESGRVISYETDEAGYNAVNIGDYRCYVSTVVNGNEY